MGGRSRHVALLLLTVALITLTGTVVAHNGPHPLDLVHPDAITIHIDNAVAVDAAPRMLQQSGELVTVTFTGITDPKEDDWIGVYTSALVDVTRHVPVKYQWCSKSPTFLATGNGSLTFRIINMRDSYIFALFRNGLKEPVLVHKSNAVHFVNYNEPLQAHLALTLDPTQMKLMWTTRNGTVPQVRWGDASGTYPNIAYAATTTYTIDQMCGQPANHTGWHHPGQFHTAIMTGLKYDTKYYYIFGDSQAGSGFSKQESFTTGPPVGHNQTLDFFIFGDLGQADIDGAIEKQTTMPPSLNTTTSLLADITSQRVVFHIGDISYARGYMTQWDNFFDQIAPVAKQMPWMTCPGNHERDYPDSGSIYTGTDSGGECGVAYSTRLSMPRPAFDQTWWSVEMGPVHYLSMSTEHAFDTKSAQFKFIENDLASVDRKRTPWIIFGGHRPMYIDSTNTDKPAGDQPVASALRDSLEPLFRKYEVDAAFWGHHHSYQRTCAVYNQSCTTGSDFGTVHVVTGAAGASNSRNLQNPKPPHFLFVDDMNHGYTRARATPTSLQLQYVTGANRVVMDDVTLKMPAHRMR